MGACDMLNMVLKVFTKFSELTRSDILLMPFILQWYAQGLYTPDFAVWNAVFQRIWILALHMHSCYCYSKLGRYHFSGLWVVLQRQETDQLPPINMHQNQYAKGSCTVRQPDRLWSFAWAWVLSYWQQNPPQIFGNHTNCKTK